jgi:hypothetical protein
MTVEQRPEAHDLPEEALEGPVLPQSGGGAVLDILQTTSEKRQLGIGVGPQTAKNGEDRIQRPWVLRSCGCDAALIQGHLTIDRDQRLKASRGGRCQMAGLEFTEHVEDNRGGRGLVAQISRRQETLEEVLKR